MTPYQALYTGCQSSVTSFSMEGNRDSYTFGITFDNALNDPSGTKCRDCWIQTALYKNVYYK